MMNVNLNLNLHIPADRDLMRALLVHCENNPVEEAQEVKQPVKKTGTTRVSSRKKAEETQKAQADNASLDAEIGGAIQEQEAREAEEMRQAEELEKLKAQVATTTSLQTESNEAPTHSIIEISAAVQQLIENNKEVNMPLIRKWLDEQGHTGKVGTLPVNLYTPFMKYLTVLKG